MERSPMTNVRVASLSVDNSQAKAAMAETEAGMRKVGDAAAAVGQATEKETARLRSYGREWQGVEKRMAGSAESLRKFEAMQGFAARAVEAGRITQEQATEAMERYRLKLVAGAAAASARAAPWRRWAGLCWRSAPRPRATPWLRCWTCPARNSPAA